MTTERTRAVNAVTALLRVNDLGLEARKSLASETMGCVQKRQAEGRTKQEIRRCVKRYLARRNYRTLNVANPGPCRARQP